MELKVGECIHKRNLVACDECRQRMKPFPLKNSPEVREAVKAVIEDLRKQGKESVLAELKSRELGPIGEMIMELEGNKTPEFRVGDIVEAFGCRGEVTRHDHNTDYPLVVSFGPKHHEYFTSDGKLWDWHKTPSLKLIERPKKEPLPPVLIKINRPEGYEDVHPEILLEDFMKNPRAAGWNPSIEVDDE